MRPAEVSVLDGRAHPITTSLGFKGNALSVYLAQSIGLGLNSNDKEMANGPTVCTQTVGPLAINLLKLDYPARWADGLGKLLGLRPEIPEKSLTSIASARDISDLAGKRCNKQVLR